MRHQVVSSSNFERKDGLHILSFQPDFVSELGGKVDGQGQRCLLKVKRSSVNLGCDPKQVNYISDPDKAEYRITNVHSKIIRK